MTPEQEQRWQSLAPWHGRWPFAPVDCNGAWSDDGTRVAQFLERFGGPEVDVLELSCLEGAHTYPLAGACRSVVAMEGRQANVERTLLVGELLGASGNVEVRWVDLETADLAAYGRFGAVFCVGILYHLADPRRLIRQCARVSGHLFIWTHLAGYEEAPGGRWQEEGRSPTCGLSPRSFWPTRATLLAWLAAAGYSVEVVCEEPAHPNGPAITLACERRP